MNNQNSSPIFSVSDFSQLLKNHVEKGFNHIRIKGEISGFKKHGSGHLYFTLKDESAVLSAVCWRGTKTGLNISPHDGLSVICTGKITTYSGRSQYQMIVENIEAEGEGALLKLLNELRIKLANEGLFDASHKLKIPFLPRTIGVITSPTGAVIRDIIHRINDRFPTRIILLPTPVQGEEAKEKIAAAIKLFNSIPKEGMALKDAKIVPRPDVIIVARGGGSIEDLWAFNEEVVVRAVFDSKIPIISAIGHETDTTLIDFVSDLRAPTPTGAAEMAVPVKSELSSKLKNLDYRIGNAKNRWFEEKTSTVRNLARALPNPQRLVLELQQFIDDRSERLFNSMRFYLEKCFVKTANTFALIIKPSQATENASLKLDNYEKRLLLTFARVLPEKELALQNLSKRLDNCSFTKTLERGFAIIRNNNDEIVSSVLEVKKHKKIKIQFVDGDIGAETNKASSKKTANKNEKQGKLF